MNFELKSLYDKKGQIHAQMMDAYEAVKKRDGIPTDEEQRKFKAWDADFEKVNEQINFHERMQKLGLEEVKATAVRTESAANKNKKEYRNDATVLERRKALQLAKERGYSALSEDDRAIVDTEMRDVSIFEKMLRGQAIAEDEAAILTKYREKRAQSSGTPSAGGYTIPEQFAGRIVESMKFISQLQAYANILRTSNGQVIDFPTNDDTANVGEMIGESADLSQSNGDLTFGTFSVGAYKFSSKMVKVPAELIQDSGVDILGYIARQLALRLARITNQYFTTGTGSNQPQGCLTGATQGKVTSASGAFTPAEMIAFQDSLDPAYREGGRVAWSMHSNILSEIKQMTIGSNYNLGLWLPSFREGEPDRILGKPYFLNQNLSSTSGANAKIMLYGDWNYFTIRMVNDMTLRTLSERYAEYDQLALFGLMRASSFVEDSAALKYFELS